MHKVLKHKVLKLVREGRTQMVQLPREFHLRGDKVRIRRSGDSLILEPLLEDADEWLTSLKTMSADPAFMKNRNQQKTPKRRIFE